MFNANLSTVQCHRRFLVGPPWHRLVRAITLLSSLYSHYSCHSSWPSEQELSKPVSVDFSLNVKAS